MPSNSTCLYLLRHGEVDPRWRNRVYGCLDVELSEAGREEARIGARVLAEAALDGIVTSPLSRARYTADLLAQPRGLVPRVHAGLVELDRGEWAGLCFEEVEARHPGALVAWSTDPENTRPPGGESLRDLKSRVLAALDEAIDPRVDRRVAVAAHGWVARVVLCAALGLDLVRAERLRMRTGCISAVRWCAGGPVELLGSDLDGPLPD